MRWPAISLCFCLALAAMFVPATPACATQIFGTATVSVSGDPGFEGLYKYVIDLAWNIDPPELDRADIFVRLDGLDDSCSCVVVRFDVPAGSSDGTNCQSGVCDVTYRGKFFCTGDADSPFPQRGAAVRFKPREQDCGDNDVQADEPDLCAPANPNLLELQRLPQKCTMKSSAFGQFVFYSSVPPALPRLYCDAVVFRHGDRMEIGNLFGSLPGGGGEAALGANAPVAINEFLVKPPAGESEFIELFNTTGAAIDISKWKLIVTNGSFESDFTFPPGTVLPAGGFTSTNTMTTFCVDCILAGRPSIGTDSAPTPLLVGENFLFDEGGVIQLQDSLTNVIDRVGYGNLGGAPISCPLVVPAGADPPPPFSVISDPIELQATDPETLATSTGRAPDGTDSGVDQNDFNVGVPTQDAGNQVAAPDLGGSMRIDALYVFPRNDDQNPKNESVGLFNPTQDIINLQNLHLSDGNLIQPMISADHEVPLEPGKELTFYHGLNATISFEFEANDRMDVYESRPEGLVRVDQLGWSQIPSYFPDSCLVRVPEATGPAGGWDWQTSGGDVNLFYLPCNLEAVPTAIGRLPKSNSRVSLAAISPNPARGEVSFEVVVSGSSAAPIPVRIGLYDVAGRLVRYVGSGSYAAGRYRAVWDGRDAGGSVAAPGVYFARMLVNNRPTGESRPVVRIRG